MYIICAGMLRSGSTWQYNVICGLLEKKMKIERLGFPFETQEQFRMYHSQYPATKDTIRIFKIHQGWPLFYELIHQNMACAFYSFRDLRDVTYSLIHKNNSSFTDCLLNNKLQECLISHQFWTNCPDIFLQRFENMMVNNKKAVAAIAMKLTQRFQLTFTDKDIETVMEENSLSANKSRIQQFAKTLSNINLHLPENALIYESHSLFHWNHIREDDNKNWYALATPEQMLILAELFGEWLIAENYESDYAWVFTKKPNFNLVQKIQKIKQLEDELKYISSQYRDLTTRYQRITSSYLFKTAKKILTLLRKLKK